MKKIFYFILFMHAALIYAQSSNDIITASGEHAPYETKEKAFDGNISTKWLVFSNTGWIQIDYAGTTAKLVKSYKLTSANDWKPRDPRSWNLQGSNDGIHWIILDTREGQSFPNRFQTFEYQVFNNSTAYQMYKLVVTEVGNPAYNILQLAEFELITEDPVEPPKENNAIYDASGEYDVHTIEKAFDGNPETFWMELGKSYGWATMDYGNNPIVVGSYRITSNNISMVNDPKNWIFQGTNDGVNWVDLDRRYNENFWDRNQTKEYNCHNLKAYKKYRLNISSNYNSYLSNVIQIAEIELIEGASAGTIYSASGENPPSQNVEQAFDGNIATKWLTRTNTGWIQVDFDRDAAVLYNRYSITSAEDEPGRDPRSWLYQASNDGKNWVTLDSRSSQTFNSRNETKIYEFENQLSYKMYKLVILGTSNPSLNMIQIAEFQSYEQMKVSDFQKVTASGSYSYHTPDKAFDGNINSKWLVFSNSAWLEYSFEYYERKPVIGYKITAGEDVEGRDPKKWVFERSLNGYQWYALDSRENQWFNYRHETKTYYFENSQPSNYYRFRFLETRTPSINCLQVAEIQLIQDYGPMAIDITASGENAPDGAKERAFDGSVNTKWTTTGTSGWLSYNYQGFGKKTIRCYQITSADDNPGADPKKWRLKANNGGDGFWYVLDEQDNQRFTERNQTKTYYLNNNEEYMHYRLEIFDVLDPNTNKVQVAEVKYLMFDGPEGYTWCAHERQSYTFNELVDVAYGSNGKFNFKYNVTGTVSFNNATFGDPISGTVKAGYYRKSKSGGITRQVWFNIPGNAVSKLTGNYNFPDNPSFTDELKSFETPAGWADAYATRALGYIKAPETGTYTFWISGDDNAELWLSTDRTQAHKRRIAYVPGWTSRRHWSKYAQQKSVAITLQAGQEYYVEVLHAEGVGGDHFAVAWQTPRGLMEVIPGQFLWPYEFSTETNSGSLKSATESTVNIPTTKNAVDIQTTEKVDSETFNLYPNPANDVLYIETELQNTSAKIYTISGRLIKQIQLDNSNSAQSVDISQFANGVYLIWLVGTNKQVCKKFIKK